MNVEETMQREVSRMLLQINTIKFNLQILYLGLRVEGAHLL